MYFKRCLWTFTVFGIVVSPRNYRLSVVVEAHCFLVNIFHVIKSVFLPPHDLFVFFFLHTIRHYLSGVSERSLQFGTEVIVLSKHSPLNSILLTVNKTKFCV